MRKVALRQQNVPVNSDEHDRLVLTVEGDERVSTHLEDRDRHDGSSDRVAP